VTGWIARSANAKRRKSTAAEKGFRSRSLAADCKLSQAVTVVTVSPQPQNEKASGRISHQNVTFGQKQHLDDGINAAARLPATDAADASGSRK
jgi:hypothetical protein